MYINENEIEGWNELEDCNEMEDGPDIMKLLLDSGIICPFDEPIVTTVFEMRVTLMESCKRIDDELEIRRNSDGFDLLGPVESIVDEVFNVVKEQEDFSVIKTTVNSAWNSIHDIIMTFPGYMRMSMYEICMKLQSMEEYISDIAE